MSDLSDFDAFARLSGRRWGGVLWWKVKHHPRAAMSKHPRGLRKHAFTDDGDMARSLCGKHPAITCAHSSGCIEEEACTACWGIAKLWWQCGRL